MLGGVLRVCRLKLPSAASTSTTSAANSGARSTAQFQHVAPLPITTAALILDEKEEVFRTLVAGQIAPLPGPNPCGPAGKAPASQRQPA